MIVTSEEIWQDLLVLPNNMDQTWQVKVSDTCYVLVNVGRSLDGFSRQMYLAAYKNGRHLAKCGLFIWEGHESADYLKGIILGFGLGV